MSCDIHLQSFDVSDSIESAEELITENDLETGLNPEDDPADDPVDYPADEEGRAYRPYSKNSTSSNSGDFQNIGRKRRRSSPSPGLRGVIDELRQMHYTDQQRRPT